MKTKSFLILCIFLLIPFGIWAAGPQIFMLGTGVTPTPTPTPSPTPTPTPTPSYAYPSGIAVDSSFVNSEVGPTYYIGNAIAATAGTITKLGVYTYNAATVKLCLYDDSDALVAGCSADAGIEAGWYDCTISASVSSGTYIIMAAPSVSIAFGKYGAASGYWQSDGYGEGTCDGTLTPLADDPSTNWAVRIYE